MQYRVNNLSTMAKCFVWQALQLLNVVLLTKFGMSIICRINQFIYCWHWTFKCWRRMKYWNHIFELYIHKTFHNLLKFLLRKVHIHNWLDQQFHDLMIINWYIVWANFVNFPNVHFYWDTLIQILTALIQKD